MTKVTFVTIIKYKAEAALWEAEIELRLPINEEDGTIVPSLRAPRELFGEPLRHNWGKKWHTPYRSRVVKIEASTKEEAKNRVSSIIEEALTTLKEVKEENERLFQQEEISEEHFIL